MCVFEGDYLVEMMERKGRLFFVEVFVVFISLFMIMLVWGRRIFRDTLVFVVC